MSDAIILVAIFSPFIVLVWGYFSMKTTKSGKPMIGYLWRDHADKSWEIRYGDSSNVHTQIFVAQGTIDSREPALMAFRYLCEIRDIERKKEGVKKC